MRFYTAEKLGPKQRIVGDGYLLCEDVPVARVGTLRYAAGEIPVEPTRDGYVTVERLPEDVFEDVAVASFQGVPVVDEHPEEDGQPVKITPTNWQRFVRGTVLNPRRGDGRQFDEGFLYADLLIQDRGLIEEIRSGKRQVSAGYDAEYEQLAPGIGRQKNIVGNHVALVDRGRCGPRCSIGDSDTMATAAATAARRSAPVARFRDSLARLRRLAARTNDAEMVQELEKIPGMMGEVLMGDDAPDPAMMADPREGTGGYGDEGTDGHRVVVNIHGNKAATDDGTDGGGGQLEDVMKRLENLEAAVAELLKGGGGGGDVDGEGDEGDEGDGNDDPTMDRRARTRDDELDGDDDGGDSPPMGAMTGDRRARARRARTRDSASLSEAFTDMLSRAEVLAPGLSLPTFDSAAKPVLTIDAMCGFRRRVLRAAYTRDAATKEAIDAFLGGQPATFHDARAFTCDSVAAVFNGASTLLRASRPAGSDGGASGRTTTRDNGFSKPLTPADLARRYDKLYGRA